MVETTENVTPHIQGPFDAQLIKGGRISRHSQHLGFYDPQGLPVPLSDIVSSGWTTHHEHAPDVPEPAQVVDRPALFCGLVLEQFGHVLLNSLGRLWAIDALPKDVLLVFYPKRSDDVRRYPHLKTVLTLLGIQNDFVIVSSSYRFKNLWVASDIFGERYGGCGTEEFYEWIDSRFKNAPKIEKNRSIYVSRSKLGSQMGRYANEDWFETKLEKKGYEVFYPEQHDLDVQVNTYQKAENLIFAESSAVHLFSMVRRSQQNLALIQRRSDLPPLISTQVRDRPGKETLIIDAITSEFWPPRLSDHLSVCILDWAKVFSQLCEGGFLVSEEIIDYPDVDEVTLSVTAGLKPNETMMTRSEHHAFARNRRRLALARK
jgi:hypothetical protein